MKAFVTAEGARKGDPATSGYGVDLGKLLAGYRMTIPDESILQKAIADVLTEHGVPFKREHRLDAAGHDRVDFMLDRGAALECKVDGPITTVARQLQRYAAHDEVSEIVLVTTRNSHKHLPSSLHHKPVTVIHVGSIL